MVKPDPTVWLDLFDEYRLTSLPHDTVLEGTLRAGLDAAAPEVVHALSRWSAPAYLHQRGERTEVVLVYQLKEEPPLRLPWAQAALFAATIVTTLGAGALMLDLDPFATEILRLGEVELPYPSALEWRVLWAGAPFAIPFLGVLLVHEMGHYVAARVHRVRVSLPYFLPFPPYFSVIGTLGAFIRLRGPTVRRSVLFDVGASGPFASFVVSVPLLAVGMGLSRVVPGDASLAAPYVIRFAGQPIWLGNGLASHALGTLLGPGPVGADPILLHPLALVGWLGLFVTALNLLPLGQLDGGHVLYALDPRRHGIAARLFLACLVPLGLLWWGWWAWGTVVLVLHRGRVEHPRVIQGAPDVGRVRGLLGWALIAIFFLSFVPVPISF